MSAVYGPALYAIRVTRPDGGVYFKKGYQNRTGIRLYELGPARREANSINSRPHGTYKAEVVPVSLSFGEPV